MVRNTTVIVTMIIMIPLALALSYNDVCENIIEIQKILLVSDYEINVSLNDVIFLRKTICQKTNFEERQEDKQKVVKEFNYIFAKLRQEMEACEDKEADVWQIFTNFIWKNFASNFLPLMLAVIIFLVRTKGSSIVLPALSVLLLSGSAFLLIKGSSCSEDHLKIWSLYADSVRVITNVSETSSKHLNHSLQPLNNGLSYNKEYIWGNWLMKYVKLLVKECFKLIFVKVE